MKTTSWILLCMPAVALAGAAPWRIMPMGDSITLGVGHAGGYRCPLSQLLKARGIDHELVGPLGDQCGGHAGYNGQTIQQIAGKARSDSASFAPDVVTLQAGTNDMYFYRNGPAGVGANATGAIARLETLLDELYAGRPKLVVALSTVTKINATRCEHYPEAPWHPAACPPDMPSNIAQFNALLPDFVARQRDVRERNVVLHDINAEVNFTAADYFYWGIHFSQAGYSKIAQAWFSALLPLAPQETAEGWQQTLVVA
eukprot:TRINITY_DN13522_c0_g2_i1.p1 TRINITY_DN13522_c0_g2~~TRINITY_DN13522_c0_g2_i1.p1  ORF type:complete len:257 (-),score=23.83 TRINITY_DN13522_c0_g2_i1:74-844(-)